MATSRALLEVSYEAPAELEASEADSIVDRLRGGSLHALAEIYDLHHEAVRAYTQRLLGDDAAAEDLVQETFVALPRAIVRYDESCSLKTFLISIATNRARHHFRTVARRRAAMERFHRQSNRAPQATPEEQVGQSHLADTLVKLLDQLPIDQRIAFVLCEVEERTSSEAAVIAGVSHATVRSRVWLAKRKLRRALAQGGMK
jgi:RNA polymerase sigma-70 factor (ECF subfamily)